MNYFSIHCTNKKNENSTVSTFVAVHALAAYGP